MWRDEDPAASNTARSHRFEGHWSIPATTSLSLLIGDIFSVVELKGINK